MDISDCLLAIIYKERTFCFGFYYFMMLLDSDFFVVSFSFAYYQINKNGCLFQTKDLSKTNIFLCFLLVFLCFFIFFILSSIFIQSTLLFLCFLFSFYSLSFSSCLLFISLSSCPLTDHFTCPIRDVTFIIENVYVYKATIIE